MNNNVNHEQSNKYNNHSHDHIANGGTATASSSTTYKNVTHKKVLGTLILREDIYIFYPIHTTGATPTAVNVGNNSNTPNNSNNDKGAKEPVQQSWSHVIKHQVSPATHARHLLKIIISPPHSKMKPINDMFEFKTRQEIETIRKDISQRLLHMRKILALNNNDNNNNHNDQNNMQTLSRKRNHDEFTQSNTSQQLLSGTKNYDDNDHTSIIISSSSCSPSSSQSYTMLTKSQFKVASSSLLASYPTLRKQYSLLLQPSSSSATTAANTSEINDDDVNTPIISNDVDFWATHSIKQSNQLSKIIGVTSRGLPSTIKSSLDIQISNNANTSSSSSSNTAAGTSSGDKKDSNNSNTNANNTSSSSSMPLSMSTSSITLGVEEMKQIFIMYPAVHAAYEEKVPLELSEELFWRKYLESEYFHRDRGKLGMSAKMSLLESGRSKTKSNDNEEDDDNDDIVGGDTKDDNDGSINNNNDKKEHMKKVDESARVATASSNDIFSRKELELQREQQRQETEEDLHHYNSYHYISNKDIAIGQFDLTSTANTERGSRLLLHSNADIYPSNDCGKKVIEKYNKHWAMVLNPHEAVAGCDLTKLAKKSVAIVLAGDKDANAKGGINEEMKRLVNSVSSITAASTNHPDNGDLIGDDHFYYGDNVLIQDLTLKNINAYSGQYSQLGEQGNLTDASVIAKQLEMNVAFSNVAMDQVKGIIHPLLSSSPNEKITDALPDHNFGKGLLSALTKKLVEDSKSEKDTAKMTNEMPQEFRNKFIIYFRRASELLRHFYALRRMMEVGKKEPDDVNVNRDDKTKQLSQKLDRIVRGLVDVYREMEVMRNELSSSDLGEKMRKMFIPVMDQLDWASKLHNDGFTNSNGPKKSGGFGFVEVT